MVPVVNRLLLVVALAACSSDGSTDVKGPFTGTVQRFVVDRIRVPMTNDDTMAFAGDLDGNGTAENKLGLVTAVLAQTSDLSVDAQDMIASGALASVVEIQADDIAADDRVGVTYYGAEGEAATVAGGTIVGGAFRSNRAATTRIPGRALVHLPVYTNADPLVLQLEGVELDLDPDGTGGFDGIVRGGIRQDEARMVAYAGLRQMFADEPERHLIFERGVDMNRDGMLSQDELDNSVIALLVTADVQLFDGTTYDPQPMPTSKDSISIAFGIHLAPCATGGCTSTPPTNTCRDRIRDAGETDVDCGGPCQKCAPARACSVPSDCQSNACTGGTCGPASCTNGVRDAFESDVDCGSTCAGCAIGQVCAADSDCANNNCDNDIASTGHCVAL